MFKVYSQMAYFSFLLSLFVLDLYLEHIANNTIKKRKLFHPLNNLKGAKWVIQRPFSTWLPTDCVINEISFAYDHVENGIIQLNPSQNSSLINHKKARNFCIWTKLLYDCVVYLVPLYKCKGIGNVILTLTMKH